MIDIGPNLTRVLIGIGNGIKWGLEGLVLLIVVGLVAAYLIIRFDL